MPQLDDENVVYEHYRTRRVERAAGLQEKGLYPAGCVVRLVGEYTETLTHATRLRLLEQLCEVHRTRECATEGVVLLASDLSSGLGLAYPRRETAERFAA